METMEETYDSDSTTFEGNDEFATDSQSFQQSTHDILSQAGNSFQPISALHSTKTAANVEKILPKPFKCPYCASTYIRKSLLEKHIRSRHPTDVMPSDHIPSPTVNSLKVPGKDERVFLTWSCSLLSQWMRVRIQEKGSKCLRPVLQTQRWKFCDIADVISLSKDRVQNCQNLDFRLKNLSRGITRKYKPKESDSTLEKRIKILITDSEEIIQDSEAQTK